MQPINKLYEQPTFKSLVIFLAFLSKSWIKLSHRKVPIIRTFKSITPQALVARTAKREDTRTNNCIITTMYHYEVLGRIANNITLRTLDASNLISTSRIHLVHMYNAFSTVYSAIPYYGSKFIMQSYFLWTCPKDRPMNLS